MHSVLKHYYSRLRSSWKKRAIIQINW